LAVGSRWFHALGLSLTAVILAMSGPLVGIGLKETIAWVGKLVPSHGLAIALYYGPSPVPVLWADLIRFLPCAVALLWPVVRLIPADLRDAARVDGARASQEFRYIVTPLTGPACIRAGLAVAVLSLGELSAGKIVETPGSQTFAHEVFTQMHYGVGNDLAALCLILLLMVLLGGMAVWLCGARRM